MLCRLCISDIAVIEKAEITPENGFIALTGETGAGKSLLIDALMMVLGGRTGRELIRAGAKCAVSEAAFFSQHPLSDEDGMLILRRELYQDGRNLCSVNGNMVTVAGLREAAESLLTIHGQHDTGRLLQKGNHLSYLDAYAGTAPLISEYSLLYKKQKELAATMEALSMDESEKERRLDMLEFWIQEIDDAAFVPGEDAELEAVRTRLRHSEKIKAACIKSFGALCGGEVSARDLLSAAAHALENGAAYDKRLEKAAEEVRDLEYRAEEIAKTLSDMGDDMESGGEALSEIEERLDLLYKLKKKYGQTIEAILEYRENAARERDGITKSDEQLAKLGEEQKKVMEKLQKAGEKLSLCRKEAGEKMAAAIIRELAFLDMEKVRFSVQITEKEFGETGMDAVEFLIATNPQEPQKPLAKIASGGELSRICLALCTVLAEKDSAQGENETLIFDEIDTGISGRAAQKVGEKLAALSKNRQVFCVTHLPQIAALADTQYKIDKQDEGDRFVTTVTPLDQEGRVTEIARMIGGDRVSETTRRAAEEMLGIWQS